MKMLLTVIALTIAAPVVAQTAAPADPHAAHKMDGHAEHKGDCCDKDPKAMKACCDEAKAAGKKMACCEKDAAKGGATDAHAGHDMSKH